MTLKIPSSPTDIGMTTDITSKAIMEPSVVFAPSLTHQPVCPHHPRKGEGGNDAGPRHGPQQLRAVPAHGDAQGHDCQKHDPCHQQVAGGLGAGRDDGAGDGGEDVGHDGEVGDEDTWGWLSRLCITIVYHMGVRGGDGEIGHEGTWGW